MKIGKQTKINLESNKILKEIYQEKGIQFCEIRMPECMWNWGLGFAHLHKRIWYLKQPELLSDFNQTVLSCTMCHQRIEGNKKLTEEVFKRLRNNG